jgi:Secretion system C-terminal sorting domain
MIKGYITTNCFLFVILLTATGLKSQVELLSPTVLSNASGEGKSSRIWIQWTLGETAIRSGIADEQLYTEGFHQPTILIKEGNAGSNLKEMSMVLYPNPTTGTIQLDFKSVLEADLLLFMTDIKGSKLIQTVLKAGTNSTKLKMENYAQGIYFLQIRNSTGSMFRSFKIIML